MTGRITSRVPAADYFALPALNISLLKELRRSALHFRHAMHHPKTSPAMTLGTGLVLSNRHDTLVLHDTAEPPPAA